MLEAVRWEQFQPEWSLTLGEWQWTAAATHNYYWTGKTLEWGRFIQWPSVRLVSGQSSLWALQWRDHCLATSISYMKKTCFQTVFNNTWEVKQSMLEHCWHRHYDTDNTQDKPLHCSFQDRACSMLFLGLLKHTCQVWCRQKVLPRTAPGKPDTSSSLLPAVLCLFPKAKLLWRPTASHYPRDGHSNVAPCGLEELSSVLPRVHYQLVHMLLNDPVTPSLLAEKCSRLGRDVD